MSGSIDYTTSSLGEIRHELRCSKRIVNIVIVCLGSGQYSVSITIESNGERDPLRVTFLGVKSDLYAIPLRQVRKQIVPTMIVHIDGIADCIQIDTDSWSTLIEEL